MDEKLTSGIRSEEQSSFKSLLIEGGIRLSFLTCVPRQPAVKLMKKRINKKKEKLSFHFCPN